MSENVAPLARRHGLNVPRSLPRTLLIGMLAACTPVEPDGAAPASAPEASPQARPMFELPADWLAWNEPLAPFRIAGNLYYVGMRNVGAYAVKTPEGTILIDTGFEQSVPHVIAALKTIGVEPGDVKMILTSHAHVDHAGGVAAIRELTGARYVASADDGAQMAAGGRGDFSMEDDEVVWPPVKADRIVKDGDTVSLGGTTLTAHVTPGHTRGCTTWSTTVEEGGRTLAVLYPCGTTAPGYDLVDNPRWPGIAAAFRGSFDRMAALPCDILLDGHPERMDIEAKAARAKRHGVRAFVDPASCKAYLGRARAAFETELSRQEAGGAID